VLADFAMLLLGSLKYAAFNFLKAIIQTSLGGSPADLSLEGKGSGSLTATKDFGCG